MNRLAGLHNPGQTACTLYTLCPGRGPHYSHRHITRPLYPRVLMQGSELSERVCTAQASVSVVTGPRAPELGIEL